MGSGFAELLNHPGVVEELELRSPLGVCAYHGGSLEKVTDVVARDAAEAAGASYYGLLQPADLEHHVPSALVDPSASAAFSRFFDHVHTVVTVHGYGRRDGLRTVLLGGRNRALARHIAHHLVPALPGYRIVDELEAIPRALRGQHPDNPVNRPAGRGVQIELPPGLRWNRAAWGWSDVDGVPRAPQVSAFVDALATALATWPLRDADA